MKMISAASLTACKIEKLYMDGKRKWFCINRGEKNDGWKGGWKKWTRGGRYEEM